MIGKLTIDKSSMNISYFLYTLKIISNHKGRISRKDFVSEMAAFVGVPAVKDGKENRTAYNKSKMVRYFGFADVVSYADNSSYLVLTHRGELLLEYIRDNGADVPAENRYSIAPDHRKDFVDLIFDSVIFDSFGKNNSGAEQSNTDIEPPKVVFKTILELGKATADEICHVMYGLNRGVYKTFQEAIDNVKSNRLRDYTKLNEKWEITNIVDDCKIIDIFTDDSIGLLISEKDEENGKTYYSLSTLLGEAHKQQIRKINAVYTPVRLFTYTDTNYQTVNHWVEKSVLGRVSDESQIVRFDWTSSNGNGFCVLEGESTFAPKVFEKAVLYAYNNKKKNIYIVIQGMDEQSFFTVMSKYSALFPRVDDVISIRHGWSKDPIEDEKFYTYLRNNSRSARAILQPNKILLPSNLHIVGTIIMDDKKQDLTYDYQFQRCLIESQEDSNPLDASVDEATRLPGGTNVLLYGVPGSGKSWTISHEYCTTSTKVERVVFHPDYTNADFVGQILPIVDPEDKMVTYDFTPGPFTTILREAYMHPTKEYVLVIEEINRGNAPAIFGDIFQLLDRAYESFTEGGITYKVGTSAYGITNKNVAKVVYGNESVKVRIPSNLSIYGTMNTSDQNVFTLDTAFQRRWRMRLIENNFDNVRPSLANAQILDTGVVWSKFCDVINAQIIGNKAKVASAEDKRLGVYFIHETDLEFDANAVPSEGYTELYREYIDLLNAERDKTITSEKARRLKELRAAIIKVRVFPEKVIKYLWDDAFKFNPEVLFDTENLDCLEKVIRTFVFNTGKDRLRVFKQHIRDLLNGN